MRKSTLVFIIALTLITGLAYPLAITGVAGLIFPNQAQGSLIEKGGQVVGSTLIGQVFSDDKYSWPTLGHRQLQIPRLNQDCFGALQCRELGWRKPGPTNKALIDRVTGDVDELKAEMRPPRFRYDLVTTTGSGLDPHISQRAAFFEVPRVGEGSQYARRSVAQLCNQSR